MKFIVYFFTLLIGLISNANAEVKIIFLNGIDGPNAKKEETYVKNETSTEKLSSIIVKAGHDKSIIASYEYWSNPGDGFFDDKIELLQQANLSSQALNAAKIHNPSASPQSSDYYQILGNIYKNKIEKGEAESEEERHVYSVVRDFSDYIANLVLIQGHQVIVVAHSQGNFFSEAAAALLTVTKSVAENAILDKKLRFVGVASVAASSPHYRYITAAEDNAILAHQAATASIPNFSVLPKNLRFCEITSFLCRSNIETSIDVTIHGFREIYTSDLEDSITGQPVYKILAKHILDSYNELLKLADPPTASIRTNNYYFPANHEIKFDYEVTSDPNGRVISFEWDFGDGTPRVTADSSSVIKHSYSKTGVYTVSLVIIDALGITNTITYPVTVGIKSILLPCLIGLTSLPGDTPLKISNVSESNLCSNDGGILDFTLLSSRNVSSIPGGLFAVVGRVGASPTAGIAPTGNITVDYGDNRRCFIRLAPVPASRSNPNSSIDTSQSYCDMTDVVLSNNNNLLLYYSGDDIYTPSKWTGTIKTSTNGATLIQTSCQSPVKSVLFVDDFSNSLDKEKWQINNPSGIAYEGGIARLSNVGANFPYAQSTRNIIPPSGNFSIFCKGSFESVTGDFSTICAATKIPVPYSANGNISLISKSGFLWYAAGGIDQYLTIQEGDIKYSADSWNYVTPQRTYETCYIGNTVTVYENGINRLTYSMIDSDDRPTQVWFGSPISSSKNNWNRVNIDTIEVRSLQ